MNEITKQFQRVLRKECLSDLSMYDVQDFFDEIPLYSRYDQIDYLESTGNPNHFLMQLALDYLSKVRAKFQNRYPRFAAITFLSADESKYIVPHIFVWNRHTLERDFHLKPPTHEFAKFIKSIVEQTSHSNMAIHQDLIDGGVRVFVSVS